MAVGRGRRWAPQPVFRVSQNVRPDRSPQIPVGPGRSPQIPVGPGRSPQIPVGPDRSPQMAAGPDRSPPSPTIPNRESVVRHRHLLASDQDGTILSDKDGILYSLRNIPKSKISEKPFYPPFTNPHTFCTVP